MTRPARHALDVGPWRGRAGLTHPWVVHAGLGRLLDSKVDVPLVTARDALRVLDQATTVTAHFATDEQAKRWHTEAFHAGLNLPERQLLALEDWLVEQHTRCENFYVEALLIGAIIAGNGRACAALAGACGILGAGPISAAICVGHSEAAARGIELAIAANAWPAMAAILHASILNVPTPAVTARVIEFAVQCAPSPTLARQQCGPLVRFVADICTELDDDANQLEHWREAVQRFPEEAVAACLAIAERAPPNAPLGALLEHAGFTVTQLEQVASTLARNPATAGLAALAHPPLQRAHLDRSIPQSPAPGPGPDLP